MRHTKNWRGLYIRAITHTLYVSYEINTVEYGRSIITGTVNRGGCTDWTFPEGTIWHSCNRTELKNYSDMLIMCYDWTKELLGEQWDGDERDWTIDEMRGGD